MSHFRYQAPIGQCSYCPRLCRYACPVETAAGSEALTPRHKMFTLGQLARGDVSASQENAEVLWGCSDCGACEDACLHGNPVGEALYAGRAMVAAQGGQPAALEEVRRNFEQHRNPFGRSLAAEQERVSEVLAPSSQAGPALLVGCDALAKRPELAARAAAVARKLDANVDTPNMATPIGIVPVCCGRSLREAGEERAYEAHQAEVARALAGSQRWWVLEPACLGDFRRAAALLERVPKVQLLSEAMVAADLAPRRRAPALTLHLPCGVRRDGHASQSLQALAAKISDDVRQPAADLPFAGCCGGRGGLREVMPRVATEMGRGRREELDQLGTDAAVAHFSTCCQSQLGEDTTHLIEFF